MRPDLVTLAAPRVDEHLHRLLKHAWQSHQRAAAKCNRKLTEASVHQLRVETRRMLALLNLMGMVASGDAMDEARKIARRLLQRFSRLRDTQVQLLWVKRKLNEFPEIAPFHSALREKEHRLIKKVGRRVRRIRLKRLRKNVKIIGQKIHQRFANVKAERRDWNILLKAVNAAFADVMAKRSRVRPRNYVTIHRMRVAFKKFRYMIVQLQPLLPGVTPSHLEAMNNLQTLMGTIQDATMMLEALRKFREKRPTLGASMRMFQNEVRSQRHNLVRQFLGGVGQVAGFWPPNHPDRERVA